MIEQRLREASPAWFEATPPIAAAVRARLPAEPDAARRVPRRTLVIAIAALVLAGGAVAATLELVAGIRIRQVERLPAAALTSPPFGREASQEAARRSVPFTLLLPGAVGSPGRFYLDRDADGAPVVTAVYGEGGSARLVLTQWSARSLLFDKLVTFPGQTSYVDVGGAPGVWIRGPEHAAFYLGRRGGEERIGGYLAGNVLMWQRGRVSYRLEAAVSQAEALALAASLRSK